MIDLISKFYKAEEMVLDTCAATFVSEEACLQLSEERGFLGCEEDSACFWDALSSMVKGYGKQVLRPGSNIA